VNDIERTLTCVPGITKLMLFRQKTSKTKGIWNRSNVVYDFPLSFYHSAIVSEFLTLKSLR